MFDGMLLVHAVSGLLASETRGKTSYPTCVLSYIVACVVAALDALKHCCSVLLDSLQEQIGDVFLELLMLIGVPCVQMLEAAAGGLLIRAAASHVHDQDECVFWQLAREPCVSVANHIVMSISITACCLDFEGQRGMAMHLLLWAAAVPLAAACAVQPRSVGVPSRACDKHAGACSSRRCVQKQCLPAPLAVVLSGRVGQLIHLACDACMWSGPEPQSRCRVPT
jgi:hypothetical protein